MRSSTAEGGDAAFFEKTSITQGMRDLITEGRARLAGVSSQAVFHLKQAMGGGKTHLLVGFGLLAKYPELRKQYCGGDLHGAMFNSAKIAAFNGRNNPEQFFWGEIANQLGKGEHLKPSGAVAPKPRMRGIGSSCSRAVNRFLSCSMRCRRISTILTRKRWETARLLTSPRAPLRSS